MTSQTCAPATLVPEIHSAAHLKSSQEACHRCHFWVLYTGALTGRRHVQGIAASHGECRVSPPSVHGAKRPWPETKGGDFCGSFKPKS